MLMIRPQPRAAMPGPNRWPSRKGAVRLTAIVWSHSAVVSASIGGRRLTPAAQTRMSGSPNAAAASSAPRASSARSPRSALTQPAWPPSARIRAAASARASAPRATSTTRAPAAARAAPMARPMPELPPVTRATRWSSPNSRSRYAVTLPRRSLQRRACADHAERAGREPAAAGQRLARRLLVQPGRQESGAERVSGPGAVDNPLDRRAGHPDRVVAAVRVQQRAVGAELEHDLRIPGVQHPGGLLGLIPAGDHHGLVAVHQEQRGPVGELQERLGPDAPERRQIGR